LLQKELYANARAISSTRGGGNIGHLTIIMPPTEFLLRAGVPFAVPVHPGPQPVHAVGATQFEIAETNRLFNQEIKDQLLYKTVNAQLKQQIITTVNYTYLQLLEDPDGGCCRY
jgi:hypothetical protein